MSQEIPDWATRLHSVIENDSILQIEDWSGRVSILEVLEQAGIDWIEEWDSEIDPAERDHGRDEIERAIVALQAGRDPDPRPFVARAGRATRAIWICSSEPSERREMTLAEVMDRIRDAQRHGFGGGAEALRADLVRGEPGTVLLFPRRSLHSALDRWGHDLNTDDDDDDDDEPGCVRCACGWVGQWADFPARCCADPYITEYLD